MVRLLVWRIRATDVCALNERQGAERQQAKEAAERAAERTLRLQQVTAALSEARTPDQVARVILQEGGVAIGAEAGAVFGLTDDGQTFELLGMFQLGPIWLYSLAEPVA